MQGCRILKPQKPVLAAGQAAPLFHALHLIEECLLDVETRVEGLRRLRGQSPRSDHLFGTGLRGWLGGANWPTLAAVKRRGADEPT